MEKKREKQKNGYGLETEKMEETGMHLGHRISKLHPKMANFVVGVRNTVHIIDLEKTKDYFEKALEFIEEEILKKGGTMVLVGTKTPLRRLVEESAKEMGIPFVSLRWLGGTFTNFKVVSQRARYYKDLKKEKNEGGFEKYTKKERIKREKELQNMGSKFEGITDLEKVPEAVFICDIWRDRSALKEAKMVGIKTIAICDSNVDPTLVDYPIPANDDAINSVKYILDKVKEVILKSKIKSQNAK